MGALAFCEVEAFLRPASAKHSEAHRACHLHRRDADSTACAVHQDGFGSMRLRGVMQRMIRGSVGNPHSSALAETDFPG